MSLADAAPFASFAPDLDEVSGTRVDQVNGHDLTDNNTVGSDTGMFGNAADFELDNSEWLSVADHADLSVGDAKAMWRFWIKLESKAVSSNGIFSKGGLEYDLIINGATDRFIFRVASATGLADLTTIAADNFGSPPLDTWMLVHCWHNSVANEIGIAVNAGTANTASYSAGVWDGAAAFEIGRNAFSQYTDGLIDDFVMLKDYILDATERTEDYNSGTGVAFADWDAAGGGDPEGSLLSGKLIRGGLLLRGVLGR